MYTQWQQFILYSFSFSLQQPVGVGSGDASGCAGGVGVFGGGVLVKSDSVSEQI